MAAVIKTFEDNQIKLTVEELDGFHFIATRWDKDYCLEVDRQVFSFETYGGALDKALDIMIDHYEEVCGSKDGNI